jgi:hypothetical protein
MKRIATLASTLLAAGATVVSLGTAASADGAPPPSASYAGGVVVSNGATAVVRVAYTCTSMPGTFGSHLFVALKQGPDVNPDNFSSRATQLTSFFSTNWSVDQGPNALTCDGEHHVQNIVLKPQPGYPGGDVVAGPAAVQICVFDNITGANELGEPIGGYAGGVTMQRVVITHAPEA